MNVVAKITFDQRSFYKLLESINRKNHKDELNLLRSLVREIVKHNEFSITGGRVWKLNSPKTDYEMVYQYGKLKKIPNNFAVKIEDYPVFRELQKNRTILKQETNELLRQRGIDLYSMTGVGDIIKSKNNSYYEYALGFNSNQIDESFNEMLSIISSFASVKLVNLKTNLIQKEIQRDLYKASEIQRNLLPEHSVNFHDYDIFGLCIPDSSVGGDYFDYIQNPKEPEDKLGIVISDAASKGLPAAIQALFVSGAIRMGLNYSSRIPNLLTKLNDLIYDTFVYERFVTLFYCELTISSNRLVLYANAGHCAPIHYRPSKDRFTTLDPTGGLLGIVEGQKFELENIRMQQGDILLLYTDGISEAMNDLNEFYGEARLEKKLKKHHKKSAKEIAYQIIESVQKFSSKSKYNDDKTLVVIKRD